MFILNTKTGLKWDVEGELLERLKKDSDYELVKEPKKEVKKDESSKTSNKKKPAIK